MNRSNQMLDRETIKQVEKNFKCNNASLYGDLITLSNTDTAHERKVTLKQIAKEIEIYVTRKDKRGELKYVR